MKKISFGLKKNELDQLKENTETSRILCEGGSEGAGG